MAVQLVREKAMEISTLERQNEKDEFLITLRYIESIIFYTDFHVHLNSPKILFSCMFFNHSGCEV